VDAGTSFVEITTGGARADERLPLIIALHGLGDEPAHFVHYFDGLRVRARVAAARGLEPWHGGYAWFTPIVPRDPNERAPAMRHAAGVIAPAIAAFARARPTCGLPVVVGFSQGAVIAFALVTQERAVVAAAFPISGMLPSALWPPARPIGGLLPAIQAFHGDADRVVPIPLDRATVAHLRDVGFHAQLHEYAGVGHTIAPGMSADFEAELVRVLHDLGGCT
jgi:phospholipase/carboxylesterase